MVAKEIGTLALTLIAGCAPIINNSNMLMTDLRYDGTSNDTVYVLKVEGDTASNIIWSLAGTPNGHHLHVSDSAVTLVGTEHMRLDTTPLTVIRYSYVNSGIRCLGEIAIDRNGIEVGY